MNEDVDMFFMSEGSNYLESIIKSRALLYKYGDIGPMITKIDELIHLELDLAIIGSKKALSEVTTTKDNIRPIK